VIDAQPLRGESLACWLRSTRSRRVVLTFRKIDALFNGRKLDGSVDLIVLSGGESDFPQVRDALDSLAGLSLPIPAVVISSKDDPSAALEFLQCGARGFIPTSLDMTDAVAALDYITAGGTFLPVPLFIDTATANTLRHPASGIKVARLGQGPKGDMPTSLASRRSEVPPEKRGGDK